MCAQCEHFRTVYKKDNIMLNRKYISIKSGKRLIIAIITIAMTNIVFTQNVIVTDSAEDILIIVNDEGSTGSITLPLSGVPATPDDKLYNYNGDLFWNAKQLETVYSVGDFAQGGVVFFVDESGEHGLVCGKGDISSGIRWYAGTYGYTQAKGDGPFSGERNTSIIIAAQVGIGDDGITYAARICAESYVNEGGKFYGDWYLPSEEELDLMYQNNSIINSTALANGGTVFTTGYFWSSTESDDNYAQIHSVSNGTGSAGGKSSTYNVRAVRAF